MWNPLNPGNTEFENKQTAMAMILNISATEDGVWPKQKSDVEWLDAYGEWFLHWIQLWYTEVPHPKKNYNKIIEHIVIWKVSHHVFLNPDGW